MISCHGGTGSPLNFEPRSDESLSGCQRLQIKVCEGCKNNFCRLIPMRADLGERTCNRCKEKAALRLRAKMRVM